MLKNDLPWTQLCCEGRKLLECRDAFWGQLALADHVRGFDPSQCCSRRMERFEAEHWPCDPLDEAMILLDDIVEIFGLNDIDDPTNSRKFEDDV